MLTYIINTSENKIFNNERMVEDKLFELAGYHRIKWMNCPLNNIEMCAKEICDRQGHLGADNFRVAVLIDFFGFDRIRKPYGFDGYGKEESGVDFKMYPPYIEAYIFDHLFKYLRKKEIVSSECEIFYIQNSTFEWLNSLDNDYEQLHLIMKGKEDTKKGLSDVDLEKIKEKYLKDKRMKKALADEKTRADYYGLGKPDDGRKPEEPTKKEPDVLLTAEEAKSITEDNIPYDTFELYCTPNVTLEFNISDYPYGAGQSMGFKDFYRKFKERVGRPNGIRRHQFVTEYANSPAKAAFDALSLSLYLIRIYEREDNIPAQGEFEIEKILPDNLRKMLEQSWNKICAAEKVAKESRAMYYALEQGDETPKSRITGNPDIPTQLCIPKIYETLQLSDSEKRMSFMEQYNKVSEFATHPDNGMCKEERLKFNSIIAEYLQKRDDTREENVAVEFETRKKAGSLKMTNQFPSKTMLDNIVSKKENEISEILDNALSAEYLDVDFKEEKARADIAYRRYAEVKMCRSKHIIGDILVFIFMMFIMLSAYWNLQNSVFSPDAFKRYFWAGVVFAGLFVLGIIIQIWQNQIKIKWAKKEMKWCYKMCRAKSEYTLSLLRNRYEKELPKIEKKRYELRQITHLYEKNAALNKNSNCHRETLIEVENRLSGMLSNLGVEPRLRPDEIIDGEFDLTKDIKAPENSIYKILSLEAIEELFSEGRK